MRQWHKVIWTLCMTLSLCSTAWSDIYIRGFGFFGNQLLSRTVKALLPEDTNRELREEDLEDALYILNEEVQSKGYLHPHFVIHAKTCSGEIRRTIWEEGIYEEDIPNGTLFDWIRIVVQPKKLYYFKTITAEGLPEKYLKKLEKHFYVNDFSILSKADQFYTKSRLNLGIRRLREELILEGYRDAIVESDQLEINDETGAVCVHLKADIGKQYFINIIEIDDECQGSISEVKFEDQIYTNRWLRQYAKDQRYEYYRNGFPDVKTETETLSEKHYQDCVKVDLKLIIKPGSQIIINDVIFENLGDTDESLLKTKTRLRTGQLLNPLEVDKYRDRIAGLGVYKSVEIEYKDASEGRRDVILKCLPYKKLTVYAITGVGTDEGLRGGLEIDRHNLFGRAHKATLRGIMSFTSKELDAYYSIPEFFQEHTSFFSRVQYGDRDLAEGEKHELFGFSSGIQRYFPKYKTHTALQYNFEKVRSRKIRIDPNLGRKKAKSSSLEFSFQQNKQNSSLYPTEGYKIYGNFETAIKELGSDVGYFRATVGTSIHMSLRDSLILHLGIRHGVYTPFSNTNTDIIRAKRFFLGGPTTLRGYKQGEAGPTDARSNSEGSLSYLLGNIEIENKLLEKFSIYAFFDGFGYARDANQYPFNKALYSAGGGVSFHTIVGPLRFGWAQNLNPPSGAPKGKYHIALGFPF